MDWNLAQRKKIIFRWKDSKRNYNFSHKYLVRKFHKIFFIKSAIFFIVISCRIKLFNNTKNK